MTNLIVVPAHNASAKIAALLRQLRPFRDRVLVVDDGSVDNTRELAERLDFAVLFHSDNRGVGAAMKTALQYARDRSYQWIVSLDADGQHDPAELSTFLRATQAYDLVIGSRFERSSDRVPDPKLAANLLAALIVNDVFGVRLADVACGYRAFAYADWLLELPADDYGYVYQQLFHCITHDGRIGTVSVEAIYDVSGPVVTRASEVRAFLDAVLLYAGGTASGHGIEEALTSVMGREDFVYEIGGHVFDCLYLSSGDWYLVQTDAKTARRTMEALVRGGPVASLGRGLPPLAE
jgi:glycosyltransferase involved in cell wall biosynthesis